MKWFACAALAFAVAMVPSIAAAANVPPSALPAQPAYDAVHLGYWLAAHERLVARAKRGRIDVLFLGDSITENWLTLGKDSWDPLFGSRGAANFGIGGDKTQNLLWRIANGELDGIAPRSVVLLIGANNLLYGSASVIEGVKATLAATRARLPRATIHLLALLPIGGNLAGVGASEVPEVNAALASLDDGSQVRFSNDDAAFLNPDGTQNLGLYLSDQIHLNAAGYRVLAAKLVARLRADR